MKRLPKQLPYWMRKFGFKPVRRGTKYFYKSNNRLVRFLPRLNGSWIINVSTAFKDFDRWANSTEVSSAIDLSYESNFASEFKAIREGLKK